jgi:DNA-binding cell septation regulator SpoVG
MCPWFSSLPFVHLVHWTSKESYHEARFEKESRYYVLRLSKDLLGDWIITLINGRIKSKLGQSRILAFADYTDAFDHFCILAKVRYQRMYQLKTVSCDNRLLVHLLAYIAISKGLSVAKAVKNTHRRQSQDRQNTRIPQATHQQMGFMFSA